MPGIFPCYEVLFRQAGRAVWGTTVAAASSKEARRLAQRMFARFRKDRALTGRFTNVVALRRGPADPSILS